MADYYYKRPGAVTAVVVLGLPWEMSVTWEAGSPSAPVDLTGYTAALDIVQTFALGEPVIVTAGVEIEAEDGRITCSLTVENIATIAAVFVPRVCGKLLLTPPSAGTFCLAEIEFLMVNKAGL